VGPTVGTETIETPNSIPGDNPAPLLRSSLRSGNRISVVGRGGARFSAPVHNGAGSHPASYTTDTGSVSWGYSGRGVTLTTHSHIAPRLKKVQSYTSIPPLGLRGLF
jgi:hypothetical protein